MEWGKNRGRRRVNSLDDSRISVSNPLISEKMRHVQTVLMAIIARVPSILMLQIVAFRLEHTNTHTCVTLSGDIMPCSPLTNTVPAINSHLQ